MAEKLFAHQIGKRGLDSHVRVTSAGTQGKLYVGSGAAESVRRVLASHGYPTPRCPVQLNSDHLSADLVVALAGNHARRLAQLGVPAERIRLLRSFDPRSGADALDVKDPYFIAELEGTYDVFGACMPYFCLAGSDPSHLGSRHWTSWNVRLKVSGPSIVLGLNFSSFKTIPTKFVSPPHTLQGGASGFSSAIVVILRAICGVRAAKGQSARHQGSGWRAEGPGCPIWYCRLPPTDAGLGGVSSGGCRMPRCG
jgi:protein-tyrosine phosphatase